MRRQQSRDSCDSVAFARQDCKVSTFGRTLHHLDQAQAACRAAARHERQFSAVAIFRAWLCSAENRPLYIQIYY